MVQQEKSDNQNKASGKTAKPSTAGNMANRLEELSAKPRRNPLIHWLAFAASLISLALFIIWVMNRVEPLPRAWVVLDIILGVLFAIEFFTRSGFRWDKRTYIRTRFFDFIAIVPVLALVQHGFVYESIWIWFVLFARVIRVVDRLLGDGFVRRNALALAEGFQEEITDRVFIRIIDRVKADVDQGKFATTAANSLARNKTPLLNRVRIATTHEGIAQSLAHLVGLDLALERAENHIYDTIVEILNSPEVEHAIHDMVDSTLTKMREEIGEKEWKKNFGLRPKVK